MSTNRTDIDLLFDCDKWDLLQQSIKYVIFTTSRSWGGIMELNGVEVMLKLSAYTRWVTLDPKNIPEGAEHPVSTEIEMLKAIRQKIIERNYSPVFIEIIYAKDCEVTPIQHARSPYTRFEGSSNNDFLRRLSPDITKMALIVLEKCNMTFRKFVTRMVFARDIAIFKSVLFMLIHGWHVLHLAIPDFRHGDTHTENFMVKMDAAAGFCGTPQVNIVYALGKTYAVPYYSVIPKVIDFDHSRSESLGIVTYTANMAQVNMYTNELARLFHGLKWRLMKVYGQNEFSKLAMELIYSLTPQEAYVSDANVTNATFPTTDELLGSKTFEEYKIADTILIPEEVTKVLPEGTVISHIYSPVIYD
jgi:hypothetical protein